ncbi:poly-gamma-glutamate hydrolase family protein [Nonomuraea sp. NPDC049028]|uniref:poly-gamma-glutamate hydrolase family protein n=1 Tax=Nonomuraea sp. NPDC049028 TaxID=3364348 RepID=UPI0037160287
MTMASVLPTVRGLAGVALVASGVALVPAPASAAAQHRAPAAAQHRLADTYPNYAELAAHETEGTDYRRVKRFPQGAKVAHIAIHGGSIEAGTSQLADYSAEASQAAFYAFEGIKPTGNGTLHITASRFDEPRALTLLSRVDRTVSWHGYSDSTEASTYVGGRDTALVERVTAGLRAAGFTVAREIPDGLDGSSPDNIANKNRRGKGLQLEISSAQRKRFFADGDLTRSSIENPANRTKAFYAYTAVINKALSD